MDVISNLRAKKEIRCLINTNKLQKWPLEQRTQRKGKKIIFLCNNNKLTIELGTKKNTIPQG
jgi:hypothetical protein